MKNIFKLLFVFVAAGALFVSCNKETNFEAQIGEINPSATYYVQFVNAQQSLRTDVVDGSLIDISATVAIALMGMPQSADIVIPLTVDASSTITANQYNLSATSITIPAGKSSGSVNLTGLAAELTQNATVKLVLNMDAGAHAATAGLKATYSMFRICALTPDNIVGTWTLDMVDSYGDGWNGASITVEIDGVGTDYTIAGASGSHTVTVPAGSQTLAFFFNSGDWDSEVTFQISGPNGAVVASDGPSPAIGEIPLDACVL